MNYVIIRVVSFTTTPKPNTSSSGSKGTEQDSHRHWSVQWSASCPDLIILRDKMALSTLMQLIDTEETGPGHENDDRRRRRTTRRATTARRRSSIDETLESIDKFGLMVDLSTHSLTCADILIRVGYEPFAPIEKKLIWTLYTPQLVLPGSIPYARYLMFVEPVTVYQSFVPLFTGKVAGHYLHATIEELLQSPETEAELIAAFDAGEPPPLPPLIVETTPENVLQFVETRGRDLLQQVAVTIVSQPFRVIAVRCLCSIVEKDTSSKGIVAAFQNIFKDDGIFGLLSGLTSRLIGDVVYHVTAASLYLSIVQVLQRCRIHQRLTPENVEIADRYVGKNYATPFHNVSDIMAINGTSLLLGKPPYRDQYSSWFDCWRNLRRDHLYKATAYNYRNYAGPTAVVKGAVTPTDRFGPQLPYKKAKLNEVPDLIKEFYFPNLVAKNA